MQVAVGGQVFIKMAMVGITVVVEGEGLPACFTGASIPQRLTEPGYRKGFPGCYTQYFFKIPVQGARRKVYLCCNPLGMLVFGHAGQVYLHGCLYRVVTETMGLRMKTVKNLGKCAGWTKGAQLSIEARSKGLQGYDIIAKGIGGDTAQPVKGAGLQFNARELIIFKMVELYRAAVLPYQQGIAVDTPRLARAGNGKGLTLAEYQRAGKMGEQLFVYFRLPLQVEGIEARLPYQFDIILQRRWRSREGVGRGIMRGRKKLGMAYSGLQSGVNVRKSSRSSRRRW